VFTDEFLRSLLPPISSFAFIRGHTKLEFGELCKLLDDLSNPEPYRFAAIAFRARRLRHVLYSFEFGNAEGVTYYLKHRTKIVRSATGGVLVPSRVKTVKVRVPFPTPRIQQFFEPIESSDDMAALTEDDIRARIAVFLTVVGQQPFPTYVAKACGVSYSTMVLWINQRQDLLPSLDVANMEARQVLVDHARWHALTGDTGMLKFMLENEHPDFIPDKRKAVAKPVAVEAMHEKLLAARQFAERVLTGNADRIQDEEGDGSQGVGEEIMGDGTCVEETERGDTQYVERFVSAKEKEYEDVLKEIYSFPREKVIDVARNVGAEDEHAKGDC
jgi:hypothetical protein